MFMGMRMDGEGTRYRGAFKPPMFQPPKGLLICALQQRLGLVKVEHRDIHGAQRRDDVQAGESAEVFDVTYQLAHAHQVDGM
ncbi:hypothetical protein PMI22_02338 [Pseudomonas sp. GM21]|nr:hypothetical protein PMI22_02338 [Pseudomonas sp. GM21]